MGIHMDIDRLYRFGHVHMHQLNMHPYACVYACVYVCMYVCMYVGVFVCVCMYVCKHVCTNKMYVCMYVCMFVWVYRCVYMSVYVYIYIYIYIHIYIYVRQYRFHKHIMYTPDKHSRASCESLYTQPYSISRKPSTLKPETLQAL